MFSLPALNLNFTKESEFEKSYLGTALKWLTSTAKHLIIVVNFLLIAAFISRFYFDKVLSDLNESIQIKSEILKQNSDFEKTYVDLQKKIKEISVLTGDEQLLTKFSELINVIPGEIKLTNFNYMDKNISFNAVSPSKQSLNIFLHNVKKLSFIKSISIPSIEKQSSNDTYISFFIVLKII